MTELGVEVRIRVRVEGRHDCQPSEMPHVFQEDMHRIGLQVSWAAYPRARAGIDRARGCHKPWAQSAADGRLGSCFPALIYRVQARTWYLVSGGETRRRTSTAGSTKARVLPEPVTASTATSLLEHSKGMVAACTGVGVTKPCASRSPRDSAHRRGTSPAKVFMAKPCGTQAKVAALGPLLT